MSGSTVDAFTAPDIVELFADEPQLLAVADAIASTQRPLRRERRVGPRALMLVAAALVAVAVAAPAFGVAHLIIDFFSSPPAPNDTVVRFEQLGPSAPEGMNPDVLSGAARRVAQHTLSDGTIVNLLVAPTKAGGFCYEDSGFGSGCDAKREIPIAMSFAAQSLPAGPAIVTGSVLDATAASVRITLSDGHTTQVPLTRVSAPIDAGFYFLQIDPALRPTTVTAIDKNGDPVGRFQLKAAAQSPLPPAPSSP